MGLSWPSVAVSDSYEFWTSEESWKIFGILRHAFVPKIIWRCQGKPVFFFFWCWLVNEFSVRFSELYNEVFYLYNTNKGGRVGNGFFVQPTWKKMAYWVWKSQFVCGIFLFSSSYLCRIFWKVFSFLKVVEYFEKLGSTLGVLLVPKGAM